MHRGDDDWQIKSAFEPGLERISRPPQTLSEILLLLTVGIFHFRQEVPVFKDLAVIQRQMGVLF